MGLGLSGGSRGLSKLKKLVVGIVSSIKTTMTGNETSTTALLAAKAIYDWAVGKFIDLTKIVTSWNATTLNTNIPSEKLVKDSLNLKADITPANGSTSALRALYIARGYDALTNTYHCVYNDNTGFYEMNGLTDISESEMLQILSSSKGLVNMNMRAAASSHKCRTLYPIFIFSSTSINITYLTSNSSTIITFRCIEHNFIVEAIGAFLNCNNLVDVQTLNVVLITGANSLLNCFNGCAKLVTAQIKNLNASFSFADSPLLSLASLQYLVTNRANGTNRITITVHPTVWSYLNDAVNYPTWNALLVDAVANQYIDFASA